MTKRTERRVVTVVLLMFLPVVGCKKATEETAAPQVESTGTASAGKPIISAVEPEFDFGRAKEGDEVEHRYKIKNIGDHDLVIEKTAGS